MQLEITPIDGAIGAQVRGADLARALDDATFAAIEAAFDDR